MAKRKKIAHAEPQAESWDFKVPASDSKGRSELVQVRCPPQWMAIAQKMCHEGIARGNRPWKTPADVWRFLWMVGIRHASLELEAAERWLQEYDVEQRNAAQKAAMERATSDLESTKAQVQAMVRAGHDWHAAQLVRQNLASIAERDDQKWWNVKLYEDMEREFGDLLEANPIGKGRMRLVEKGRKKVSRGRTS